MLLKRIGCFEKYCVTQVWEQGKNVCCVLSHSVVSDSLWLHGPQPTQLLCPWDFLGKSTEVSCHFLLQGIFPTQGWNPCLHFCIGRQVLYCWAAREARREKLPLCKRLNLWILLVKQTLKIKTKQNWNRIGNLNMFIKL